jgi:feruloyl esterase
VQVALPAHCEVQGILHERKGIDGQDYAIRFRVRLPAAWNGRFLMQGVAAPMARWAMPSA